MPPQQRQRLADGVGELLGFGSHCGLLDAFGFSTVHGDIGADT
jgi:hypothetical protein